MSGQSQMGSDAQKLELCWPVGCRGPWPQKGGSVLHLISVHRVSSLLSIATLPRKAAHAQSVPRSGPTLAEAEAAYLLAFSIPSMGNTHWSWSAVISCISLHVDGASADPSLTMLPAMSMHMSPSHCTSDSAGDGCWAAGCAKGAAGS